MIDLVRVSAAGNSEAEGNVIFIHGLCGDGRGTWSSSGEADFWPQWLADDCENLAVWSVDYDIPASRWKGDGLPLLDRSISALDMLHVNGIDRLPSCFVVHSFGGLLLKQMYRHSVELPKQYGGFRRQYRGALFFSTPNSGSHLADFAKFLSVVLRPTITIKELQAHQPHLLDLNSWYRDHVVGLRIEHKTVCETRSTHGFTVVNRTSADLGLPGVRPVPLEYNHVEICKAVSRDDNRYILTKDFVSRVFEASALGRLEITIDGMRADFDEEDANKLRYQFAGFLNIDARTIKITLTEGGS